MPFFATRAAGAIKAFGLTAASSAASIARDVYFRFNGLLLKGNTGTPLDTIKQLPPPVTLDNSTNNFALTLASGTPRASVFNPVSGTYYSTYFDGGSSVDFALSTTGAAAFGTGDFTIEAWIYLTASPGVYAGIIDARSGADLRNWGMGIYNLSGLKLDFMYGGTRLTGTIILVPGRWYHIAVTRASGTIRTFVGGLLDSSAVYASAIDATNTIIRTGAVIDPYYFTGYISNMRLLKGNALYTAAYTVPTSTLISTTGMTFLAHNYPYFLDQGSNLAVTVNSTPRITQFAPVTQPTTYEFYGSAYFSGSDWIQTTNTSAFDFSGASTNFTIEAWVYNTGPGSNRGIMGARTNAVAEGWCLYCHTSNTLYMGSIIVGNAYADRQMNTTVIRGNTWNHIALVKDSTGYVGYVNGIAGTKLALTTGLSYISGQAVTIGALGSGGEIPFLGYISNVRMIKGTALYNGSFTLSNNLLSALSQTSLLTVQYNGSTNNNMFVDKSNVTAIVTRAGDTTQGTFSPYSGSYSVFFNGSSNISAPTNTGTAFGTDDFTIEVWVFPTANPANGPGTIVDFRTGPTASATAIRINSSFQMLVYNGPSNIETTFTTQVIGLNAWYHIAYVRIAGTAYGYINGQLAGSIAMATNLGSTQPTLIGANQSAGYNFNGYISNFRVVKGTALYTSVFAIPVKPLAVTSRTTLLVCNGPAVTMDSSINKMALTVTGTPSSSLLSPFSPSTLTQNQGRYSVYFNGSSRLVTTSNAGMAFGTGTFTVECWIYLTVAQTVATMHITDSATTNVLFIKMNPTNICIGRAGITEDSIFTYSFIINTWYHIAFARVGSTVTGYVNGTSIGSNTNANSYVAGTLTIGAVSGGTSPFTGYISNLRYSSSAIYTSPSFTPLVNPLIVEPGTVYLALQDTNQVDASKYQIITTPAGGAPVTAPFSPFTSTPTTVTLGTLTVPYVIGGSMYFDGTGDYLSIPDSPIYNLSIAGTWTVECWVYMTGGSGYRTFITKRNGQTATCQWEFGINPTTNYLYFYNGTVYVSTGAVNNNIWYHCAFCYDGTNMRMFLNGVVVYTGAVNAAAGSDVILVGTVSGPIQSVTGYIADLRIIRGRALYAASFIPPTLPVANTPETILLLRGDNPGIFDSAGGNDLQTVSGAKVSTTIKKFNSGSMQFNGSTDYLVIPGNPIFNNGTADFTVDCWVYLNAMPTSDAWPTAFSSHMVILESGTFNAADGFACIIGATKLLVHDNADAQYASTSNHNMVINTWYHLAYVRSSNTMIFYVNGSSLGSVAFSASLTTGSFTYIGCETTQGAFLNGYIDDLRFTRLARYTGPYFPLPTSSPQETGPSETEAGDAGVTYIAGDGLSSATAGTSAAAIKAQTGTNADGAYWINLPTVGPTQVYCIMNSAILGGGWMMAMKATRGTTFPFSSTHWTTVTTLNPTANNRADGDAKFHTMNYHPANDIMAVFPDITTNGGSLGPNPLSCWTWLESNFNGSATTLINFFNTAGTYANGGTPTTGNYGGRFIKDAKTFSGWQSGVFSSQVDIRFYGFNYKNIGLSYGGNGCVRWGFGWNENGEGLYSSPATLAQSYSGSNDVWGGIGMDTITSYSAGDYVSCCQDTTGINRSARVEIYIR